MGQEPNIPLRIEDLPRPTPQPDSGRRWSPNRPGELHGPGDVPWGGMFGTPGPDTGYVLHLLHRMEVVPAAGEDLHDLHTALAAIAAARASHFGRAPTNHDVRVAMLVLGLGEGVPDTVRADLATRRPAWIANLSHRPAQMRRIVDAVSREVLAAAPADVAARAAAGDKLVDL